MIGAALALALGATLIAGPMHQTLDFRAAMRLAALAYTPVAIFDLLAIAAWGSSPSPLVLFALGMYMLYTVTRLTASDA